MKPRSPTPIEVLAQTEKCVVCGDSADGFHYGVRSCRGCNAFFRRAVTFNMTFNCRRGGRCPVDKNARCACRACRLAKCYAVGMDKKAVQPKRENAAQNGTATGHDDELDRTGTKTPKNEYESQGLLSPASGSVFTPLSAQLGMEVFMPVLPPSPPADCNTITRQCYEFEDQKRRRRAMLSRSLEEILSSEFDTSLRCVATAEDYSKLFQVQMVLMFEWVEKLPEFRALLDPLDKARLLRAFALRYILLDNVYHTMELGYNDRMVLVNNNYIIPGQPPSQVGIDVIDERRVCHLMFGNDMKDMLEELVVPMSQMQITVGEMVTLRKIMFWNPGTVGLSTTAFNNAQEASNAAVRELHVYFEAEDIGNVDTRIGNLLLLLPAFTKHVKNLYETVKLIPSFGRMHEWNSFMDDLLHGV